MPKSYSARGTFTRRNTSRRPVQSRQAPKPNFHPSQFIKPATITEQIAFVPQHRFADFDINPQIKRNITDKGFETPSHIQDLAIPPALAGRDVIGIANTGTGKTAAFAVPLLNRLMAEPASRALIIAPTRELAQQIEEECRSLARNSGIDSDFCP
jgi:ATP-dependent RNA helicase RhlE